MEHVYLGPSYSKNGRPSLPPVRGHPNAPQWKLIDDAPEYIADILARPIRSWFQGRWSVCRSACIWVGRRSSGLPECAGVADRINRADQVPERWRPFCPSMLGHRPRRRCWVLITHRRS